MDVGQRIKELRLKKKLTSEALGVMVGVGKSTIRKWENGIIPNIKRYNIVKLASALETTPNYLMCWSDECFNNNFSEKDHELKELVSMYHSMNEIGRKKLMGNATDLYHLYSPDNE